MGLREDIERNTDQAWNKLYQRLEQDGLIEEKRRLPNRRNILQRVAAIAAVFVGVVLAIWWFNHSASSATETLVLSNGAGEPTLVTSFEDGSIIYLGEQASVEYPSHFAEDKREVTLRGEAFFEVSKDSECPFIIHTQTATVEVLGTSFNVQSKDRDSFSISVRTGKVRVTSRKDNQHVYVVAGETAFLQPRGLHVAPTRDASQFNSYLRHVLFKDQSLCDVVRIINENTDSVQLKIAPELEDRRITVTFRNNTPEDMAQILCSGLKLKMNREKNTILIN